MNGITFRRALFSDAEKIADIHFHSWNFSVQSVLSSDELALRTLDFRVEYWINALAEETTSDPLGTIVATAANEVKGFATLKAGSNANTGEIKHIYVNLDSLGQGIGTALLRKAEGEFTNSRLEVGELWTFKGNTAARMFYDNRGWRSTGATRDVEIWQTDRMLTVMQYQRELSKP